MSHNNKNDPNSFFKLLSELQDEYYKNMETRISRLKEAQVKQDGEKLLELFHNYKGTGKTHGYPIVTLISDQVESMFLHDHPNKFAAADLGIELLEIAFLGSDQNPFGTQGIIFLEKHPIYHRFLALRS